MGNDRSLFTDDPTGLPVYEGRMIDNFDHRAKTYQSGHGNSAVWIEREFGDPAKAIVPQWHVLRESIPGKLGDRCDRFRIGFGDVANPRNERSFTATLIPPAPSAATRCRRSSSTRRTNGPTYRGSRWRTRLRWTGSRGRDSPRRR